MHASKRLRRLAMLGGASSYTADIEAYVMFDLMLIESRETRFSDLLCAIEQEQP